MSVEFNADAELFKSCGYPLGPGKSEEQLDRERRARLYRRIEEIERRLDALERRGEDDGK